MQPPHPPRTHRPSNPELPYLSHPYAGDSPPRQRIVWPAHLPWPDRPLVRSQFGSPVPGLAFTGPNQVFMEGALAVHECRGSCVSCEATRRLGLWTAGCKSHPVRRRPRMSKRRRNLPEFFLDNPRYTPVGRTQISLAKNMRWQLTLDRHEEVRTGAPYLRVVRWEGTIQNRRRTWRKGPGFNIRSRRQWDQIRGTVDSEFNDLPAGAGEVTASSMGDGPAADTPVESEADLRGGEPVAAVPAPVSPAQVIAQHRVEARIPERRLAAFRARRSLYKHQLAEFKGIIADTTSREKEVQDFFREKDPFWMFGFQYVAVKPKVTFPPGLGTVRIRPHAETTRRISGPR